MQDQFRLSESGLWVPKEVGLISNPGSKRNREEKFYRLLERIFESNSLISRLPEGMSYKPILRELILDKRVPVLAVNSGDGGVHKVFTEAIELSQEYGVKLPPFLVIPGGTINVLSQAVGHRKWGSLNRPWCLEELFNREELEIQTKDFVAVEDSEGIHYGFIFASGVVSDFYEHYERKRDKDFWYAVRTLNGVLMSYVLPGVNLVPEGMFDSHKYDLVMDGNWSQHNFRGIGVYAMAFEVLNMNFPHQSGLQVIGGSLTKTQLAKNLPKLLGNKPWVPESIRKEFFGDLDFELVGSAQKMFIRGPPHYILDGERYYNEPEVRLSTYPVEFVKL